VHYEDADPGGNPGQLRRAIDLGIVHVQASGQTTAGDGLTQAVEEAIQSLVGIELGMGDEPTGVIQRGLEKDLHLSPAGPPDPGTEQHIRLPDLVSVLGFVLFMRRGFGQQQLPFGETAGAQEAIERGGREAGLVVVTGKRQFAQQGGAGAVRVLAFEPFDQGGGFGRDGARQATVLPWFGGESGDSVFPIVQGPFQQRVHRQRTAARIGNVVLAGGDLLGTPSEFAAGQFFQDQRRDDAIAKESDFFGFVIHRCFLSRPKA
jgi:hypothetical protein